VDDIFEEQAQFKVSDSKMKSRELCQAIREHKMVANCRWCLDSKEMLKHLIIAVGSKVGREHFFGVRIQYQTKG
jgi:hypothetical protein